MTDVTALLGRWNDGDLDARTQVVEAIYADLTRIANAYLAKDRRDVELQPHALVHEAYLRLVDTNRVNWHDRTHFFATAAKVMRSILIDRARQRSSAKRNGGMQVSLTQLSAAQENVATDIMVLHEALEELHSIDPQRAVLIELRYFGGLTLDEVSEHLGISPSTAKRHWQVARAWLYKRMQHGV